MHMPSRGAMGRGHEHCSISTVLLRMCACTVPLRGCSPNLKPVTLCSYIICYGKRHHPLCNALIYMWTCSAPQVQWHGHHQTQLNAQEQIPCAVQLPHCTSSCWQDGVCLLYQRMHICASRPLCGQHMVHTLNWWSAWHLTVQHALQCMDHEAMLTCLVDSIR